MTPRSLKFLSLNCWGLPLFTPSRKYRLRAIAAKLKKNDWDVVALQEVWLKKDRDWLIKNSGFEFHHTFDKHKPLIGPGLLFLSRFKILESDFYQFVSRGFPHKLHEFDFHSAKGIGFALIETPMGEVPVFLTHLIAKYVPSHSYDSNHLFRIAQILELVFYVREKAKSRSFILCGDLNAVEDDIELQTLLALIGAKVSGNKLRSRRPTVDYVLCGTTTNQHDFKVCRSVFAFTELIERLAVPYSDHFGISATVRVTRCKVDNFSNRHVLLKTLHHLKHTLSKVERTKNNLKWIPLFGWYSIFHLQPQLHYIRSIIGILEADLKVPSIMLKEKDGLSDTLARPYICSI